MHRFHSLSSRCLVVVVVVVEGQRSFLVALVLDQHCAFEHVADLLDELHLLDEDTQRLIVVDELTNGGQKQIEKVRSVLVHFQVAKEEVQFVHVVLDQPPVVRLLAAHAEQADELQMFVRRLVLLIVDHAEEEVQSLANAELCAHVAVAKEIVEQPEGDVTVFLVGFRLDGENKKSKDFAFAQLERRTT